MATAPELLHAERKNQSLPPLENGEHLDQKTFHERYAAMPEKIKAELIGGRVYIMASPVLVPHSGAHSLLVLWLGNYHLSTPGTQVLANASTILGDDSEPQPDISLRVLPEFGGQTRVDEGWLTGAPELVVEVASATESYDLHEKRAVYAEHNIREYLVYAARQRRVYWWTRGDRGFFELAADEAGVFKSVVYPGLWLDAQALVLEDAEKMNRTLQQGLATSEHAAFVSELALKRKSAGS